MIRAVNSDLYKIGITGDYIRRIKSLKYEYGCEVEPIVIFDFSSVRVSISNLEELILSVFHKYRVYSKSSNVLSEWMNLPGRRNDGLDSIAYLIGMILGMISNYSIISTNPLVYECDVHIPSPDDNALLTWVCFSFNKSTNSIEMLYTYMFKAIKSL